MLPRQFRLKRSALFPKTLSSGKSLCQTPYFLVLALPRAFESATPTRFGFVVSKKVHNRANRRNRVKRRLREIIRTGLVPAYFENPLPYISIVVIARKGVLEASYSELKQSLMRCLKNR